MDPSSSDPNSTTSALSSLLPHISALLGWIYTLSWSLSFYPQPLLNLSRRSTSGTTIDFPTINILGFIALSISNAAFLYSSTIREQYRQRNGGLESSVRVNDLVFAVHAVFMSAVGLSMFWPGIWGWEENRSGRGRRISGWISAVALGSLGAILVAVLLLFMNGNEDARLGWAWIDVMYILSYVKVFITLVKYMPQILTNYWNQSTVGWSISQILLDLIGGVLSMAQLGIDSYLDHNWSGITGNPVKLALANVSIFFDLIFMWQHYVLYSGKRTNTHTVLEDGEDGGLLREQRLD